MRKQHEYDSRNTTCRDAGHDWMLTAAVNWRWCRRENCRASERLVNGEWVSNAKLYREHNKRQRHLCQSTMWEPGAAQ